MDEIFEQLIECDKGKGRVKILQGLAMILVVLSAFFLLSSLVIAIVMLLLAIGAFILSYLIYCVSLPPMAMQGDVLRLDSGGLQLSPW